MGKTQRFQGGLLGTNLFLRMEFGEDFFDTSFTVDRRVWVQVIWEDFPEPKRGRGERLLFAEDDEAMRELFGKTERLEASVLYTNAKGYVWKERPVSIFTAGKWSPGGEAARAPRQWFPKFPEDELVGKVNEEVYLFFLAILEDPRRHLAELWNEDLRIPA